MAINNRIFVLGSGAIGIALAVNLLLNNRDVLLVRTSRDDISETEITISMKDFKGEIVKTPVKVISLKKLNEIAGIIVVTTKSYVNESIVSLLKEKQIHNSPIVILQNGLGVEEPFITNNFQEIYRCVLFATSQIIDKDFVQYKPVAPSLIGRIKGKSENLQTIVEMLNTHNFEFIQEENIQKVIWEKAIINSAFNSICPLLEVDNGIFYRNKDVLEIATKIIRECMMVAKAMKIDLSEDKILTQLLAISNRSSGQFISTLQDIQNKRKTEIESLNLKIAQIAETLDSKPSTEITALLGKMILLKSEKQLLEGS